MLNWNNFFEDHHKKLLLACLVLFVFFSSFHLNDLFLEDEICFAGAGGAVAETGRPVFYQGEQNSENIGAWHPPLNVYLVGFAFYLGSEGEAQARTMTMILVALTILVVFYLALSVFRENKNKYTIAVLSSYIFALNPLTIQSGLMTDIDTGILMLAMAAFILLFLKWKDSLKIFKLILIGAAFGAVLWAKLTTPPVLLVSIFLFYLLNKNYKKAVIIPVVTAVIGFLIFSGTWWLVAKVADLPFHMPYTWVPGSNFGFRSTEASYIFYVLGGRIKLFIFWVTPFIIYFAQLALRKRWQLFRQKKGLEDFDLLLIIGLLIFIQYTIAVAISYYFPKYYVPMLPFLAVVVAYCICQFNYFDNNGKEEPVKNKGRKKSKDAKKPENRPENTTPRKIFISFAIIFIISFILMALILGDPNLSRDEYGESFITLGKYIGIFFISMFILIFIYKFYCKYDISLKKVFFITVVICLASSNIYINIIQANADYSVRYNYGEDGLDKVVDYIKTNTDDSSMIISPKDVGYYSELRYFEAYGGWMENWDSLNDTISENNITHIVLRRTDAFSLEELPEDVLANIRNLFDEIRTEDFGDFVVFERE